MKRTIFMTVAAMATLFLACSRNVHVVTAASTGNDVTAPIETAESNVNPVFQSLGKAAVERAVNSLVSSYRMGGNISVIGVQQEGTNAVADLKFNAFQYATTFEGSLIRAANYKPPQRSGRAIPLPSEMFPPRKNTYSSSGKAYLAKYNDGRWVVRQVRWGSDKGINGNVVVR